MSYVLSRLHAFPSSLTLREETPLRLDLRIRVRSLLSGTNTILTFMTLASKVENSLPKVSYIKASEIWFLGCTIFLFAAMFEFAFVNTIYRRKCVKSSNAEILFYILSKTFLLLEIPHAAQKKYLSERHL